MIFIVLSQASLACEPISTSFDLLSTPVADIGVVFEGPDVPVREDFVFTVDGVDATGELHTWTDPGTGRSLGLFLPDPPLAVGQAYHIVTADEADAEVVSDGVVAPALATDAPRIATVTLGDVVEGSGADCLEGGIKYREVSVETTEGTGVLVLQDQASGEVVRVAYLDGAAATLSYFREGTTSDFPCVEPTNVRLDGAELSVAVVCSDRGNVCDCASTSGAGISGAGMGWAVGALVFALRRARRAP